ncbi:DUF6612 family protein [Cohnella mopanensis]|uniref:DUF6612 family protein n=1 Tax=Cohnella mopanensis TaxID=2911966 RepID=UPI001EF99B33|nr:DUF6612 family protein [Cohnella mopanensis]
MVNRNQRAFVWMLTILLSLLSLVACSRSESVPSPSASPPSVSEGTPDSAEEWLIKGRAAALKMNKYGFQLQMKQELDGGEKGGSTRVEIDMQGRAERNPLKLDQTIKSVIDGEKSTLRAVVVPDAYYMYLPEYEEWSKLSKDVAAENVATLSDYQVNPEQALASVQKLGESLKAERDGKVVTVRYEGVGPEASAFLTELSKSTLGISVEQTEIVKSIEVLKLKVIVTLDAEQYWPLSYRIESDMNIELEPGVKSTVNQTLAGTYSKHNVTAAITVPKEAQAALDPDELGKELGLE